MSEELKCTTIKICTDGNNDVNNLLYHFNVAFYSPNTPDFSWRLDVPQEHYWNAFSCISYENKTVFKFALLELFKPYQHSFYMDHVPSDDGYPIQGTDFYKIEYSDPFNPLYKDAKFYFLHIPELSTWYHLKYKVHELRYSVHKEVDSNYWNMLQCNFPGICVLHEHKKPLESFDVYEFKQFKKKIKGLDYKFNQIFSRGLHLL